MKVILREEVENLGNAGELVTVKDGYARNYLIPRALAVRANERNVKEMEHVQRAMEARRGRLKSQAEAQLKAMNTVARVVMTRACGGDGKLFGSVTTMDIAAALAEKGVGIDRRSIKLSEALKHLGDFDVQLKLGQGVMADLKVSVEPDEASAKLVAKVAAEAADRAEAAARSERAAARAERAPYTADEVSTDA